MTFKLSKYEKGSISFITAKISGGKHLFNLPQYSKIILDSLQWLIDNKRIILFAFVIMPNHFHLLAKILGGFSVQQVCHNFESFTAHEILKLLEKENKQDLINFLKDKAKNFKDREHNIWQDIQAQNCYSDEFLEQKLRYIHNNPVAKGWNLVKDRKDYLYSSACYYDSDLKIKPMIEVEYLWNYFFGGDSYPSAGRLGERGTKRTTI